MSYDYSKLKGRIVEICGSQAEFARKMGLSERTMSLKINGRVEFKQDEIMRALTVLGLGVGDIQDYFFKLNVQGD